MAVTEQKAGVQVASVLRRLQQHWGVDSETIEELQQLIDRQSRLSDKAIMREIAEGGIYISPFDQSLLNNSSHNVRLGRFYYPEKNPSSRQRVYNMYDPTHVEREWGTATDYEEAIRVGDWRRKESIKELANIDDDEDVIVIGPGETILAHTVEFIGGSNTKIDTQMNARSSIGRNCIEVCKCAGKGDIGYHNRWTMEITNNSRNKIIPLVVGRPIAQIIFYETEGTDRPYYLEGHYQSRSLVGTTPRDEDWCASNMLPKLYKEGAKYSKK